LTISSDDRSVEWDFCLIFAPWGYDEPEILPSSSR
jgi:hypothetical protein